MSDEQLLTVREVARRCQRSEETVRRWIWSGKLPARKLGNQLFVEEADLRDLLSPRVREAVQIYEARASARGIRSGIRKNTQRLYAKYGYSPLMEDLREDRGQIPPSPEQAWRDMEADERFQDEMVGKYGSVDVQRIFRELRR
jgi:excisionase family DNA binding protein